MSSRLKMPRKQKGAAVLSLTALISASLCSIFSSSAVLAEDAVYGEPRANEVYFANNSAKIPASFDAVLARHGRRLAAHPDISVRIEGHADLRGPREYNLRLGEHRAQAVKQVLIQHGASPEQFSAVSFGEEFRASDSNLAKDRRVVLAYDGRSEPPH